MRTVIECLRSRWLRVTTFPSRQRSPRGCPQTKRITTDVSYRTRTQKPVRHPGALDCLLKFRWMAKTTMQRAVVAVYCAALVYCIIWLPWCVTLYGSARFPRPPVCQRVGYGWLWAGPAQHQHAGDIFDQVGAQSASPVMVVENPDPSHVARPDMELVVLRVLAATLLFVGATLLVGVLRKPASSAERR